MDAGPMTFSRMKPPRNAASSSRLIASAARAIASGVRCFGGTVASCPVCGENMPKLRGGRCWPPPEPELESRWRGLAQLEPLAPSM